MRLGIFFRNFGPVSSTETITTCAEAADSMGLDDLWLSDHIAIPPKESEGSGGRYLDPLASLAYLAGVTERIGLGTSVLIVPYRPALVTAKWLATIQELSNNRLSIGAAVGWMESEFKAAGVDRARRGAITDETLGFWDECFANDEVSANGQNFIFKPRPPRPKIFIGGAAPHALTRTVKYADGWLPTEGDPDKLREPITSLQQQMSDAGKAAPEVIPLTALAVNDIEECAAQLAALSEVGVAGVNHAGKYNNPDEFKKIVESLLDARSRAGLA